MFELAGPLSSHVHRGRVTLVNPVHREHRVFPRPAFEVFESLVDGGWLGVDVALGETGVQWSDARGGGRVVRVDAPKSLTLALFREGVETKVFLVLVEGPQGTSLDLLHSLFASSEARDAEAPGWHERLARLEERLR